ncbi:SIMPL domain-containing protein [Pedobacter sp. SAFR-022]|uniref:SIMPL domain-containing protein n=1 Tax=Pedobacter sp. SAFR-022 TaxID=3436861 RepID=UPI003F7E1436
MKKLFALAFVAFFSLSAVAQQVDLRKKITVSGVAESEVTPDIIYVGISLKEYFKDNNSKNRIEITTLENQLFRAVQQAGLPKESLTVNSLSAYATRDKKKNPEFLASKQYRLKVNDLNRYNDIIAAIDPKGIAYTNIESYDYSKIERLKLELKVKALQNAKQKATFLVESLGDKLGSALDIQEINNEVFPQAYRANTMMMKSAAADMESAAEIDFKQIKLSYTINAVFEIK